MPETYHFDERLQVKILSLLLRRVVTANEVKPDFFDNPILAALCASIHALGTIANIEPSYVWAEVQKQLGIAFSEYEGDLREYISLLFSPLESGEIEYLKKTVYEFAEFVVYKKAVIESMELIRKGSSAALTRLRQKWTDVVNTQFGAADHRGTFYFSSLSDRIRRRYEQEDVLKTLIPELDNLLAGGGFGRGELNVFLAAPSVGKSFALLHMAKSALFQKRKVLFYSYEMREQKISARLDAAFSGILIRDLRENAPIVARQVGKYKKMFGDALCIMELPANRVKISQFYRDIDHLQHMNFFPDVIITDYINLIMPEYATGERHKDLGQVYVDLRGFGQELNAWNITAAQGNRGSTKVEFLTITDLAESFEGSMHADVIISLNQTMEERSRQELRLFLAKNRSEMDKEIIRIHTNYAYGEFCRRVD